MTPQKNKAKKQGLEGLRSLKKTKLHLDPDREHYNLLQLILDKFLKNSK